MKLEPFKKLKITNIIGPPKYRNIWKIFFFLNFIKENYRENVIFYFLLNFKISQGYLAIPGGKKSHSTYKTSF